MKRGNEHDSLFLAPSFHRLSDQSHVRTHSASKEVVLSSWVVNTESLHVNLSKGEVEQLDLDVLTQHLAIRPKAASIRPPRKRGRISASAANAAAPIMLCWSRANRGGQVEGGGCGVFIPRKGLSPLSINLNHVRCEMAFLRLSQKNGWIFE